MNPLKDTAKAAAARIGKQLKREVDTLLDIGSRPSQMMPPVAGTLLEKVDTELQNPDSKVSRINAGMKRVTDPLQEAAFKIPGMRHIANRILPKHSGHGRE
jgi:hypothetical protein